MSNTPRRKSSAPTRKKPTAKASPAAASGKATGLGSEIAWPKVIGWGIGGIAILAILFGIVTGGDPLADVPEELPDGVRVVGEVPSGVHIDGDIDYEELLPPGGPHNAIWQNCGFYDGVIRTENAIHSLEHGAVWITYRRADMSDADFGTLRDYAGRAKVLVSEQPLQESAVVATAWGYQYSADGVDDAGLQQFLVTLAGSPDSPEPGGACTGGVASTIG